jgi:hypothetical protein
LVKNFSSHIVGDYFLVVSVSNILSVLITLRFDYIILRGDDAKANLSAAVALALFSSLTLLTIWTGWSFLGLTINFCLVLERNY